MQTTAGIMLPTILAAAVYRSNIYTPRHTLTQLKHDKQLTKAVQTQSCLNVNPLNLRSMHILLASTFVTNIGIYVPFILLVSECLSGLCVILFKPKAVTLCNNKIVE